MENERPETPALREAQQVIARLRESLSDMNRLVETRDATIKELQAELTLRINANRDAARLGQELARVRAELSADQGRLASAEADAARLAFRVLELEAQPERPEPVADGSSLHARLQAEALRFPAGNPRRRYLMEMADEARRLERDLDLAERQRTALLQELEAARRDLARAYEELKKLPSPAEYARERLEETLQQDDLRKQLARAEAHNAGLRREVQDHLAALSRIAVKLDVPAQGQWLPIEQRLADICDLVGAAPGVRDGDLLARVQRLLKRDDEAHSFSVGLHKVRAALGVGDDAPVANVVDRMRRVAEGQDAVRVGLRRQIDEMNVQMAAQQQRISTLTGEKEALERARLATIGDVAEHKARLEREQRELLQALGAARCDAAERKDQIAALRLTVSLAEQENKLLAERLGNAYKLEMDARRELADARILLDITLKQARQLAKPDGAGDVP